MTVLLAIMQHLHLKTRVKRCAKDFQLLRDKQQRLIEHYWFVYSVDTITSSGEFETFSMILDHDELHEILNYVQKNFSSLLSVNVSMYDKDGDFISERDITKLFATPN